MINLIRLIGSIFRLSLQKTVNIDRDKRRINLV